ncbi:hypothetical protein QLQ12_44735 [Actinoplanes sp. NEAU-A12]|uniref:Uncharacterized protein n=1 Tax=Actinoplanes sandaracinus TaxID=3045177 RepID=A0ABT6X1J2_9ACTN|nr:hypothetical protein [Actinoplanes sandaracinus]MDI6105710.1 hypothetical protein [Actinoplanes sandaracinus]
MIIDLDVAAPPRPAAQPPARWRRVALVVATLSVLLLGSSGAPAGPLPVAAVLDHPGASLMALALTDDMIYTSEQKADNGGRLEVMARAFPGNDVVWSRRFEADDGGFPPSMQKLGAYLAVASRGAATTLLDAGSGQVVWESGGSGSTYLTEDRIVLWEKGQVGLFDPGAMRAEWWQPLRTPVVDAVIAGRYLVVSADNGDTVAFLRTTGEVVASVRGVATEQYGESRWSRPIDAGRLVPVHRVDRDGVTPS